MLLSVSKAIIVLDTLEMDDTQDHPKEQIGWMKSNFEQNLLFSDYNIIQSLLTDPVLAGAVL